MATGKSRTIEPRRLVLHARRPPGGNYYVVHVIEQTHRSSAFVPLSIDLGSDTYRASNGLELRSQHHPALERDGKVYLRGDASRMDFEEFKVPSEVMDRLRAAVTEYNQRYGGNVRSDDPEIIC